MTDTSPARRWALVLPVTLLLAVVAVTAVLDAPPAQMNITVDPAMTMGPARAPVTIVEFSDYQ